MSRPDLRTLPLLGMSAVVIALAGVGWRAYAQAWLPVYAWVAERLLPEFRAERSGLVRVRRESYVELVVTPRRPVVIGARVLEARGRTIVQVPAAHAAAHPAMLGVLAIFWARAFRAGVRRPAAAAAFALAAVELVDMPFCLAGGVWDVLIQSAGHSRPEGAALAAIASFLDNGGRYGLTIVVGVISLRLFASTGLPIAPDHRTASLRGNVPCA